MTPATLRVVLPRWRVVDLAWQQAIKAAWVGADAERVSGKSDNCSC